MVTYFDSYKVTSSYGVTNSVLDFQSFFRSSKCIRNYTELKRKLFSVEF